MHRLLIVGFLIISAAPLFAQAQQPDAVKLKADAQKVVSIISDDKAKIQAHCEITGLGRQMMEALHAVVRERGGDRVRLRVAPGNTMARHLYHSMGYRQVGIERGELLLVAMLPPTILETVG